MNFKLTKQEKKILKVVPVNEWFTAYDEFMNCFHNPKAACDRLVRKSVLRSKIPDDAWDKLKQGIHTNYETLYQYEIKNCDKTGLSEYCNNKDVRRVQLKSQSAGAFGTNLFDGNKVYMCEECRKANNGSFKIIER